MDNQDNENRKNRTDNFYILSGFTYGPSDPNSLEETRIAGVTITVVGPQNTTLVSDPFGNFSSGLLSEGKYKLSFFDPSQKYFRSSIPIFLGHDLELPIFLQMGGDKKRKERKAGLGTGTPNVIHGFTLSRKKLPVSGITVTVKSVMLEKEKQGAFAKVFLKIASVFKRKGQTQEPKQEEQSVNLELKTNIIGRFSTKKLPNGSYIVSCDDPSGKNKFSSKFVVLKGKPISPLLFRGYSPEDLEELKKKFLERKGEDAEQKEPEEKTEEEKAPQQQQQVAQQKLEKQLRKAQAQRTAAQARGTTLSRASRETFVSRARLPFTRAGKYVSSFGQRGMGLAGQGTQRLAGAGIRGAEAGLRTAMSGMRLAFSAVRVIPLIGATPVGWIAAGIGIVLLIIIIIVFFGGGSSPLSFLGGEGSSGPGSGGGTPGKTTFGLNYYIPFRDPSVIPENIRSMILTSWPNAQIDNWDIIVSEAIANSWNPAMLLALWIEESGAQGVPAADPLGCLAPSNIGKNDINLSLQCVFTSFGSLTNDRFADFMCRYSDGYDAPCAFANNPNFPPNIRFWYEKLVPTGPGALVEVPPPVQYPLTATCPIAGGTAANVTCGSFFTLRSSCGHCRPDAGYANYMNLCTYAYEAINYAEDIGGASGQDVILPSINGAVIDWTLIDIRTSTVGSTRHFSGVNRQTYEEYWIQFHHVDASYGISSGKSGDVGARICTSSPECNHVHVEFSTVTPGGGKTSQDAPLFLCV